MNPIYLQNYIRIPWVKFSMVRLWQWNRSRILDSPYINPSVYNVKYDMVQINLKFLQLWKCYCREMYSFAKKKTRIHSLYKSLKCRIHILHKIRHSGRIVYQLLSGWEQINKILLHKIRQRFPTRIRIIF